MNEYGISNDFLEIVSGTTNTLSKAYKEAASHLKGSMDETGINYLKKFLISIESLAKNPKVNDKRIRESKGEIQTFSQHDNIVYMLGFLQKNLRNLTTLKDLQSIYDSLVLYAPQYRDGYRAHARLVELEYETAIYLLVTGLVSTMTNGIEVVQNGVDIQIKKKASQNTNNLIDQMVADFAKQLTGKRHKEYLISVTDNYAKTKKGKNALNESVDNDYYSESVVMDTVMVLQNIFDNFGRIVTSAKQIGYTIKQSVFGIIPAIRGVLYLRYKKKADTVLALDQQCAWIRMNIEQINRRTDMDPQKKAIIIKKQQAVIAAYQKKAAKLRAELNETQRDAAQEIKKENPTIASKSDDGDLVLESTSDELQMLFERASSSKNVADVRKDSFFMKRKKKANDEKKELGDAPNKDELGLSNEALTEMIRGIFKKIAAETALPSVSLKPGTCSNDDPDDKRTVTKFGGIPWWPKDMAWPEKDGKPMVMLAQINFGDIPHIDGFPASGLAQFFAADDDPMEKGIVIYHEKVDGATELLNDVPTSTLDGEHYDTRPFEGVYYPSARKEISVSNTSENEWLGIFTKYLNEMLHQNWKTWGDIPKRVWDITWKVTREYPYYGSRIGGHPYFTQNDVRSTEKKDALILQIDSEDGIMWGDCGIAQFFGDPDAIAKGDFKNAWFTWDCC